MQKFHLTARSENSKTGPIPVSMTSQDSCPNACPLKDNGCFASYGPMVWFWRKLGQEEGKGVSLGEFLKKIVALPAGQVWRHNQAGDLPGNGDALNTRELKQLVKANKGKRGFTYTHKPLRQEAEKQAIADANAQGFTVNLSGNTVVHADQLKTLNIGPVVAIVPTFDGIDRTPAGHKLVPCPGQTHKLTCEACLLCALPFRKSIIAFTPHGTGKNHAAKIARG
jgi:hypothetical protein